MPKETPRYHYIRKQKATTSALLRCLVIAYLLFLAWQLASGASAAESPGGMPPWLAYTAAGVFCAVAAGFGVYTWKSWQAGLKAAELTPEELAEEAEEADDEIDEEDEDDREEDT